MIDGDSVINVQHVFRFHMSLLKDLNCIEHVSGEVASRKGYPESLQQVSSNRSKARTVTVPYWRCRLCPDNSWMTTHHAFSTAQTSNFKAFRKHIWRSHGVRILIRNRDACKRAQRKHNNSGQMRLSFAESETLEDQIANKTIRCIVDNSLALSLVQSESFRELVMVGIPPVDGKSTPRPHPLPTLRAVRRNLAASFGVILKKLREQMASVEGFSLSLDGWRSGRKNIQSLHVYCLSKDGNAQAAQLVAMLPIRGSHTAKHVAEVIRMGMNRAGLNGAAPSPGGSPPKLLALTTDGASNMSATADILKVPWIHCCAHTLNLAVQVSDFRPQLL